jgi:hypothetical protein
MLCSLGPKLRLHYTQKLNSIKESKYYHLPTDLDIHRNKHSDCNVQIEASICVFCTRVYNSWVAHTKEEARQTAVREADPPAIFHKTSRKKIPSFCSAAPGRRLPAIVAPFLACPRTAGNSGRVLDGASFVLTCLSSIAMGTKGC